MREEDTKNNKKEFSTKSEDIGTTDAPKQTWHDKEKDEVIKYFKVEPQKGLETEEAKKRLLKDGPNEIVEAKKETPLMLLINQFKNFMVILLLVSTVISFVIGEVCDGIAILAIVIFAALLGFIQEYRAGNAIASLRKMAAPKATVIRNGIEEKIPAREVVAGDIIVLRAGDKVPADGRLIETVNLKVEEAALTGESVPIVKTCGKLEKNIALGDMKNLVFMGTTVAYGKGKAVVYATGMKTEFGKIAKMIEEVEEIETPLQVALDKVGKKVAYISIIIAIILMILGLIRGSGSLMNRIFEMFIWGVSIIVAIVPEALPAVVTISLGVGVQRMVKRHALVRKLHAVETLGATDYICSDKTGTLTQDRMVAEVIYLDDSLMKVSGKGYEPKGDIVKEKDGLPPAKTQTLERFMEVCALCNDSNLIADEGSWKITGDPTEAALIVLAKKAGFDKKKLLEKYPETGEVPFTPERKRMTTVHLITGLDKSSTDKEGRKGKSGDNTGRGLAFMKGGAEIVLERCESIMLDNKIQPLLPEERKRLLEVAQKLASKALRVLGLAYREIPSNMPIDEKIEEKMTFLGFAGLRDPPRAEVKDAINTCKKAGIKPVMITGDHKLTAVAIAKELGILTEGGKALTGAEVDTLPDDVFEKEVEDIEVYARVSPAHKMKVVSALQKKNHVVAMTGDGINDAPALRKADIGVAMGITGTDVSREAAAMVLTDDNFSSIVAAVHEGREIFENIKKYLVYLLAGNLGLVIYLSSVVFFGTLMGIPSDIIPMTAIQILFINLICDGFIAVALSTGEPRDPYIMDRKPRRRDENIFSGQILSFIGFAGLWTGLMTLFSLYWAYNTGHTIEEAVAIAFLTLLFLRFFHAFNCRSIRTSAIVAGPFKNSWLSITLGLNALLAVAIVYLPVFQRMFRTYSIALSEWGMILALGITVVTAMEVYKLIRHHGSR